MKNIFFLFLMLVVGFSSCTKDEDTLPINQNENDLTIEQGLEIVESFNSTYGVFKNVDEFVSIAKLYKNSPYEVKEQILNRVKFKTTTDVVTELYLEIDNFSSEEELKTMIENYNHILDISSYNGENRIIESAISLHTAYPFLNEHQILKIGDVFYRYMGNSVGSSINYEFLVSLKSELELKNSESYLGNAIISISGENGEKANLRDNDMGVYFVDSATKDHNKCKHRRRVVFTAGIFNDNVYGPGGMRHIVHTVLKANPERQGIFCYWKSYSNQIDWQELRFKAVVKRVFTNGSIQTDISDPNYLPAIHTSSSWDRGISLADYFPDLSPWIVTEVDVQKLKTKISTTGIGSQWLEIDKNDI